MITEFLLSSVIPSNYNVSRMGDLQYNNFEVNLLFTCYSLLCIAALCSVFLRRILI